MRGSVLSYLPPTWEDWLFESAWAFQQASPGIVGLAWKSKKEWQAQPLPQKLYVAFIDSKTGEIQYQDAYTWSTAIEEIQLWAGITKEDWIITWETDPANILLCPIRLGISLNTAKAVVIDEVKEDMTRMGPVVFVVATKEDVRAIHIQPLLDDTSPSFVRLSRVVKKHMSGPRRSNFTTSILEYFWLGGTVQTKVVEDNALKAGVAISGNSWYLVTFNALHNMNEESIVEFPEINFRNVVKGKPYWHLQVAGGPLPLSRLIWKYQFRISIPATLDCNANFMEDVIVGASLIAGPSHMLAQQKSQPTIVVAVGLLKKEAIGLPDEQARPLRGGELLCLSATGQVVQECREEMVEQVELCLVGDAVIGVDRIQRRWRMWKWEPLTGKEQFTTVRWLDEAVVHAHVATNHENSDPQGTQYWLIEERPKGLRVSRCDGQTLAETEPPLDLPGWSLPSSLERSVGHFDWPVKKGIIGHDDALLLIVADEQSRMVLYRVEASEGK